MVQSTSQHSDGNSADSVTLTMKEPKEERKPIGRWRFRLFIILATTISSVATYLNYISRFDDLPTHLKWLAVGAAVVAAIIIAEIVGSRIGFVDYLRGALTSLAALTAWLYSMSVQFPEISLWLVLLPTFALLAILRIIAWLK